MLSHHAEKRGRSFWDILTAVLVLGTFWGFSEVVLGEAIRTWGVPYRAGILTGIGMGIMGAALGYGRRVLPLLGIALIAMAAHQLAVPVLKCSVLCRANSCAAVLLQSGALCAAAAITGQRLHGSGVARLVIPVSAALAAAGAFYFAGMRLSPCAYLLSFNHPGGLLSFLGAEGLPWAVFSGILFPASYLLGNRLTGALPALKRARPAAYYITAAACLVGCYASIFAVILTAGA